MDKLDDILDDWCCSWCITGRKDGIYCECWQADRIGGDIPWLGPLPLNNSADESALPGLCQCLRVSIWCIDNQRDMITALNSTSNNIRWLIVQWNQLGTLYLNEKSAHVMIMAAGDLPLLVVLVSLDENKVSTASVECDWQGSDIQCTGGS